MNELTDRVDAAVVDAYVECALWSSTDEEGADRERADSLRERARTTAQLLGKPVKLIRSTGIEVVEEILP